MQDKIVVKNVTCILVFVYKLSNIYKISNTPINSLPSFKVK